MVHKSKTEVTLPTRRQQEICAYKLINTELAKLKYKAGDEVLVHRPTWRLFGPAGGPTPLKHTRVETDSRVSLPSGRASLLPLVPSINPFLLRHGAAAAVVVAVFLVLPILHLLRWYKEDLPWLYTIRFFQLVFDGVAICFLLISFCSTVYLAWPSCSLAYRREYIQQQSTERASPLDASHANLLPLHHGETSDTQKGEEKTETDTKCFLVLINPASGEGRAVEQYEETIKPLLEKQCGCRLLPLVLHEDSMPFLFLFLFAFSSLFSCCLLLGGDGTYNTVTSLMQRVAAAREAEEIPDDAEETDMQQGDSASGATPTAGAATEARAANKEAAADEETEKGRFEQEAEPRKTPERGKPRETGDQQPKEQERDDADDTNGTEAAIPPPVSSSLSSSKDSSSREGSCCSKQRMRWDSNSLKLKRHIAKRDKHRLTVTPVPLGTSNTWCSEFLFSQGATKAGQEYIQQATEEFERLRETLERRIRQLQEREETERREGSRRPETPETETETADETKRERRHVGTGIENTETDTSNIETETETKGTETEKTGPETETKGGGGGNQETTENENTTEDTGKEMDQQKPTTEKAKRGMGGRKIRGGPRQRNAEMRRKETERKEEELAERERRYTVNGEWMPSTWAGLQGATTEQVAFEQAREELDREIELDWDARETIAERGVSDRDKARAAAARVARKHLREAAERETEREQRIPFLVTAKAALALEKRLLHPKAEAERDEQKEQQKTVAELVKDLVDAEMQIEWLSTFVEEIGPGNDSNLNRKGIRKMLHFWCRRIAEGQSAFTSLLKVTTRQHTNYCVNNLEFGYLGACMVHSEDLRWLGHLRYVIPPLYQLVKMKKQFMTITATLANGKEIQQQGDYLMVALDLIQHWTDDVFATPWAQLNADHAWLLLIHAGITRPQLLAYSKRLKHLGPDCPGVERLPVKKVSLTMQEEGVFGLDGEVFTHCGTINLEVLPRVARVVVSRHDVETAGPAEHPEWAKEHLPQRENQAIE